MTLKMYNKYCLSFVFAISLFFSCAENNFPDEVEIPFNLENGRIVLEATANGRKGRFIFDTGATESYLDIKVANLLPTGYTTIEYKGKQKNVLIHALNKITFGDLELETHSWVINRSDYITYMQQEGYDGLLGTRIFEGYWCELSFSKSKIILHKEKPEYFTNYLPAKIENKYDADLCIPVIIDNKEFYFVIDTGLYHAIYFPEGVAALKNPNEYRKVLSDERVKQYHLVKINYMNILDETYNDVSVMTNSYAELNIYSSQKNMGLLGLAFLKYYDFLFDYRELRIGKTTGLYYEPNTPLEERNYGFYSYMKEPPAFGVLNFSKNNSGILIQSVIEDSIAYNIYGLRPGTIITKINSKPINEIPRDEILQSSFYLTVDNYTILENDNERTLVSPLKGER